MGCDHFTSQTPNGDIDSELIRVPVYIYVYMYIYVNMELRMFDHSTSQTPNEL